MRYPTTNGIVHLIRKSFALVRNKSAFLGFICSCIAVVFCLGVSDSESIDLYLEKMQSLSRLPISTQQKLLVASLYLKNANVQKKSNQTKRIRKDFNKIRAKLRNSWEQHCRFKWPNKFEAHHIIPINAGGINSWWNIFPLSSRNHKLLHQSMEEQACFSHDFTRRYLLRFLLRFKLIFFKFEEKVAKPVYN